MVSGIFITFDRKNNINQMEIENNKYLYYAIIAGCIRTDAEVAVIA